jgi:hypothetical protein
MIGCLTESNNEKLTTTTMITKTAKTDHPINELIAKRWSASIFHQTCRKIKAVVNLGSG